MGIKSFDICTYIYIYLCAYIQTYINIKLSVAKIFFIVNKQTYKYVSFSQCFIKFSALQYIFLFLLNNNNHNATMPYNLIHIDIDTPWRSVLIIFSRYATTVCVIYKHTYTTVVCKKLTTIFMKWDFLLEKNCGI